MKHKCNLLFFVFVDMLVILSYYTFTDFLLIFDFVCLFYGQSWSIVRILIIPIFVYTNDGDSKYRPGLPIT